MPKRWICESAKTSKNLTQVSDFGERLFWRLITTADDYGRFLGCVDIVKAACFPLMSRMTAERVEKGLQDLESHELIRLYPVADRRYGYFINWEKHQGPPRAKTSKYPDPPGPDLPSACSCAHLHAAANTNLHTCSPSDTDTKTDLSLSGSESDLDLQSSSGTKQSLDGWTVAEGILEFLNRKTGKTYQARRPNKDPTASLKAVKGLLQVGYTEQQLRQVIGNRLLKWGDDPKMQEYLRPETLFRPSKFEQYLGELGAP